MEEQKLPVKQGRHRKDAALVLRDRYWAIYLKNQLPEESYASLERKLLPHLKVTKREHGEGFSQPGSLSKVAAGKRGLSASLEGIPDAVRRADELVPGATAAYTSLLWSALAAPGTPSMLCQTIAPEVRARLFEHHFSAPPAKPSSEGLLSLGGVRRAARLWHRDGLGLLLCHCPAAIGISKLSLTAEAYVLHLLHWASCKDPALQTVKADLIALIKERYRLQSRATNATETRLFLAPRIKAFSQGIRLLLGP